MTLQQLIHEANENSIMVAAIFDEARQEWFYSICVFEGDTPVVSITTTAYTLQGACGLVDRELFRVLSDYEGGKLTLPDMGHFQVTYHKT